MPTTLANVTLPALGFWASLNVASAVEIITGFRPALKWPNDLLAGSRKMAGILIEGETIGTASRMIVGVGINVNEPSIIPAGLADKAAWLSQAIGHLVDRTALCAALLQCYESTYDRLLAQPQGVIEEWAAESGYGGREVEVSGVDGKVAYAGVVRRIDPDGALVLDTESGPVRVTLGDVAML